MEAVALAAEPPELSDLSGSQRAAALLMALGQEHGAPLWAALSPDEVRSVSAAMAQLGTVPPTVVSHLLDCFSKQIGGSSGLHGSAESTERLLASVLPSDQVREVMADVRSSSARQMWQKLADIGESALATYLRGEHPQTVAVVLARLDPDHAARVLAELPRDLGVDVVTRMLRSDPVQGEVLQEVEQTLRSEFIGNAARSGEREPHEMMAELFNVLDQATETTLLTALEQSLPDSAERIRALMFTFEDLTKLPPETVAAVVKAADKKVVTLALKAASEGQRAVFFAGMTERSAALLKEDMAGMGAVRARDCENAQAELVRLAKSLADKGEILIVDPNGDDTMIL